LKIRIKFSKHGSMKFIGHLDIMRYFQKANIRAGIDIAFSEGFNPHQIMSFAAPLGVGLTSDGEYFDIQVKNSRSSKESIEALNSTMVDGISILEYKLLPDDAKKSMSLVSAADYIVYPKSEDITVFDDLSALDILMKDFLDRKEIFITKQTKKSEATVDIKPFIYDFSLVSFSSEDDELEDVPAFFIKVQTGSDNNTRPEQVLAAFYDEMLHEEFPMSSFQIHRQEVYTRLESGEFVTLGSLGEDIE